MYARTDGIAEESLSRNQFVGFARQLCRIGGMVEGKITGHVDKIRIYRRAAPAVWQRGAAVESN